MAERADARRNRERLLATAAAAFAESDGPVSLEGIARDAGVGIGTLYRHFPNREALIEAVYRSELAEVSATAADLVGRYPPPAALRRWMDRYATFVAAKKGMAESLRTIFESGAVDHCDSRASVFAAVQTLLDAGAADGSLRADVRADDVVFSLLGILLVSGSGEQSQRMLDLLVAGVQAGAVAKH
ncbi:TetR/AcrR family transcriptional regulator [Mycobacterium sp. 21AC1]|uniref:TetR/AcrR family transcriptional regulator n=1 Tax=[Mycobacterium] appelbergii TaxID=2939269 RepID=UPI00293935A9|nr:TetR/AcrR family transcriptional regulator [Mycobacterium sp. 21AC1]MDV3127707.1 TetR/AcrR family transcriptional regulator [Mycobacterium sp. 21AC1]